MDVKINAICELHVFVARYLRELGLQKLVESFTERIEKMSIDTFGYKCPSTSVWVRAFNFKSRCDEKKLSAASSSVGLLPSNFPALDYHELNLLVIRYLMELGLEDDAEVLANLTSDDNDEGKDTFDAYTRLNSTRDWIIPFTAAIYGYQPTTDEEKKFFYQQCKEEVTLSGGKESIHYGPFTAAGDMVDNTETPFQVGV